MSKRKSHRLPTLRRRLQVEPLEERRMLAVVTVDTLGDTVNFADGVTSLREAIFATNLVGGADQIEFAAALTSGGPATILLTQGELAITDSLTINGPGAELLTIRAFDPTPDENNGDGSRVFNINDGNSGNLRDVSMSGLTLTGGDASGAGGAIFARENLTVAHSIITGNSTNSTLIQGGGGIYSGAGYAPALPNSLSVIDCTITDNAAGRSEGAGIRKRSGSLVIEECTISGNTALLGGGVSVADATTEVQISGSTFSVNLATGGTFGGGALFVFNSHLSLDDCTLSSNSARRGGGLYLDINSQAAVNGCVISGNSAGSTGGGGGIFGFNLSVTSSTITGNSTAGSGGGIFAFSLTVINSTISNNTAGHGGGISGVDLTVTNSTIRDNSAGGDGGGILKTGLSKLILTNSTVNGNSAAGQGRGGGIWVQAGNSPTPTLVTGSTISGNTSLTLGGGIYSVGGTLTVAYSTITNNMGGGVYVSLGILNHTIVAGNNSGEQGARDVAGRIINASYSLIGFGADLLGPLADNGGPTLTHALLPGSPAIDAGDPAAIVGINGVPFYDQRGFAYRRVVNGRIDIGAFEFGATSADYDQDGDVDGRDFLFWQRGGSPTPFSGDDLELWQGEYGGEELLAISSQLLAGEGITDFGHSEGGSPTEESGYNPRTFSTREGTANQILRSSGLSQDDSFQYIEEVDRAFEELGASVTLPGKPAVAPFGEMVARRGVKGLRNAEFGVRN